MNQLDWIPYRCAPNCFPKSKRLSKVTLHLNEGPLLSWRHRILGTHSHYQIHFDGYQKLHTAEYNRQKNIRELDISLNRKEHRREQHMARLSRDQNAKLRKLRERYAQLHRCRCVQLEEVKSKMREERKMFKHQREVIFENGIVHPNLNEKVSPMLVFLAISAPLWLIVLLLRALLWAVRGFFSEI